MRAEHFLELGQRSFGIVAFEFCRADRRPSRRQPFFGMQLTRDVGDDVFAAEPARTIEQPAGVRSCCAGRRERLPQRQRVAIASKSWSSAASLRRLSDPMSGVSPERASSASFDA